MSRVVRHVWWVALLGALALLAIATKRRIDRVDALTNSPTWSVDSPQQDANSATGFAQGERTLIVPGEHTPSYWWIMEAQQTAHDGRWRLRHIDYDAPPKGRETLRTAPYRWWLIAVGWGRRLITGESLGAAIERGTLVADPLLLALLLVFGSIYVARYFGSLAAAGFAIAGASLFPLAAGFQPGAPDPHSLAWVLALGSLLPLLVPAHKVGTHQRVHFIVAGIAGGLGFWNDARSQAPVLLAIVLGAIVAEVVRGRSAGSSPTTRPGWRTWALAGVVTTLAASAFEFAPNHLSWSLDAVSPVHALAWWGCGELLMFLANWARHGRAALGRRTWIILGIAVVAIVAWPVTGFLSKSGGLLASDFYARELANHPRGATAAGLRAWLHNSGDAGAKWTTLLPVLLVAFVLARLIRRRDQDETARLVLALIGTAVAVVLACLQLRWWNLVDAMGLGLLALFLADVGNPRDRSRWATLSVVLLVLPGAFVGFPAAVNGDQLTDISPSDAQGLVARDFSYWLARRHGAEKDVVFSTPIFSTAAAYYSGCDVVTSSDEEDKTGYLAAMRIATADTLDEASVLFQTRGITRVVLPLWDPMLPNLVRSGRNLAPDAPLPDDALLVGLLRWGSPVWMRPMNYAIPPETGLQDFQVVAYAVQAPMENDLFLSRLADFFVERGMLQEAQSVRHSLQDYPRSIVALGAMARVDLVRKDQAQLAESVDKLIPFLARVTARHLPPDRRISLATVLIQTQHADLARNQITLCLKTLDAATLRTLTPGAVRDLLALMRVFKLSFENPALKATALALLPPAARGRLAQ